jgi:hypothetical protein
MDHLGFGFKDHHKAPPPLKQTMKALEIDHDDDDGKSDGDHEETEREEDVKQNPASTTSSLSEEIRLALADWTMSLVIGGLVVSFWRVS